MRSGTAPRSTKEPLAQPEQKHGEQAQQQPKARRLWPCELCQEPGIVHVALSIQLLVSSW